MFRFSAKAIIVLWALAAGDISPEELKDIRKLLKEKGADHEHAR